MKKAPGLWLSASALAILGIILFIPWANNQAYRAAAGNTGKARNSNSLFDDIQTPHFKVAASAGYKNLTVYILAGEVSSNKKSYVTLQEALQKNMVSVRETGEVNELKIDNHSGEFIYINSGDIVKGGRQDRTIQYDVIIGPNKINVDLASFCVEHGRWSQRGNEDGAVFMNSEKSLSSKELKLATKYSKSQQESME